MRRRSLLVVPLLLGLGGYFAYRSQHELRQTWGQIYHELGGGRVPDPAGVLDDPVFEKLPVPDKPVSLGRYTPATPRKATPAKPVRPSPEPEAAPEPVKPQPVREAAPRPAPPQPAQPRPVQPAPSTPAVPAREEVQAVAPVPAAKPLQPPAAPTPRPERAAPEPQPAEPAPVVKPASVQRAEPVKAPAARPTPPQTPAPTRAPGAAQRVAVTTSARFIDRVTSSHRLHLLVMGNDQDSLRQGRADVLMVLTLDPVAQRLTFLNIPRDTRVLLPGRGWVKINAGYAYGGPELQTTMVERFLGIPMDKYVEISQGGFKAAIDAVGGVEVRPRFAFTVNGRYEFPLGPQRLSGEMALIYSTMRKQDPEGDFGRNRRQQEVLRSLLAEMGALEPLELAPQISGLLGELASTLRTDLTPAELLALRRHHAYLTSEQATERVEGRGGTIGGTWFYSVPDRERQRLHLLLRDQ